MIAWDEKKEAAFKNVTLLAYAMLVAAPIVNLFIAYIVDMPPAEGGEYDMMLYILLIISVVQPSVVKFIEHFQITSFKKSEQSQMAPENLFTTLGVIKFAFIETIYLFGLVVYLMSGNMPWMLYFYPVGIGWTLVYWPTRSSFENFINRIESNAHYAG